MKDSNINTSTDKYDQIGVEILRNEQGSWFHIKQTNVHVPIQKPIIIVFKQPQFSCMSFDNTL